MNSQPHSPKRLAALLLVSLLVTTGCTSFAADDPTRGEDLRAFAQTVAARHDLDGEAIERLLIDDARHQPDIIEAISRPAEALPWHRYREIFLTEARIRDGVAFRQRHADTLAAAEARYGVPPAVITAIIGVETFYGRYRGRHRVIDALRTLGFGYPPRADFFRSELEAFLVLAAEENLDPREPLGSYAGAMGIPQFISSSYRAYAVDFDDDGQRDLFTNTADAIGSVGNYFARHGWEPGAPVAVPARVAAELPAPFRYTSLEPRHRVHELTAAGVRPDTPLPSEAEARLLQLDAGARNEHWVTLRNFYVITRYNHSPLYAMAVYQLAGAIDGAMP